MELIHLVAAHDHRDEVLRVASTRTVLFECSDAETVLVAASMAERWTTDFGVWLVVSPAYTAQLAARDVATLAALAPLRHVVVEASSKSESHAEVVRALLTNDEVNFSNDVVTLRGAYNRPAPPRPITVWSYDGERLVSGEVVIAKHANSVGDDDAMTSFTS